MRHKPIEVGEAMQLLGMTRKLTTKQVARCRKEFFIEGTTIKALALHYRVSNVTMHSVIRRKGAYDDVAGMY